MVVEAPAHTEGRHLRDRLHLVDAAVTRDAADSCRQVRVVREVGVVGKLVHPNPAHRPAGRGTLPNRCERCAVPFHQLMAVHAGLGGRNVRDGRHLDRRVTVPAVETELADVEPVAVRDGLYGTVAHVRVPGGEVVPDARDGEDRTDGARDGGHDRELVPPRGKDLRQRLRLRAGERQVPRLRVRDATVIPHPRATKKIRCWETTEILSMRPRYYP